MITPRSEGIGRIVRVLTYGKEPDAVNQAIVDAVAVGHRVLVKVISTAEIPIITLAATSAITDWAEELSQQNGLSWERIGGDVLFQRSLPHASPDRS